MLPLTVIIGVISKCRHSGRRCFRNGVAGDGITGGAKQVNASVIISQILLTTVLFWHQ